MSDRLDKIALSPPTWLADAEIHDEVGSTNDLAKQRARERAPTPRLIAARRQTAGRGRGSNRWWSSEDR